MDLRQLATFRSLARTLSFTRTAGELNYAQSSVTAQIQSLEEELGVPLFDRPGRRVALTDAGQRLLDYAEKILALADEARIAVPGGEEPSGMLKISSNETQLTYRLPEILQEYRLRYPAVKLNLQQLPTRELERGVSKGEVDVMFIMDNEFHAPGLEAALLRHEPVTLFTTPDHPLAKSPLVHPDDLEHETILLTEVGCTYRSIFEHELEMAGVFLSSEHQFGNIEVLKQSVLVGMGVGLLPEVVIARELAEGWLVPLRWYRPDFTVETYIVWHGERWMSPALRAFIDLAQEKIRAIDSRREAL
ncbi:MAG TPA: LysR family transcriptional regulator [Aggregatilineales bacterium]|nr:LysR family transcriptional regulator [Aggregatilineales bacterium]